ASPLGVVAELFEIILVQLKIVVLDEVLVEVVIVIAELVVVEVVLIELLVVLELVVTDGFDVLVAEDVEFLVVALLALHVHPSSAGATRRASARLLGCVTRRGASRLRGPTSGRKARAVYEAPPGGQWKMGPLRSPPWPPRKHRCRLRIAPGLRAVHEAATSARSALVSASERGEPREKRGRVRVRRRTRRLERPAGRSE